MIVPELRAAPRFRAPPWVNAARGISMTVAPKRRARAGVPSSLEESTTIHSSGFMDCADSACAKGRRSSPGFKVGTTTLVLTAR